MTPTELNEAIKTSMLEQNKNKTAALRQIKQIVTQNEKKNGRPADERVVASAAKLALKTALEEASIRTKARGEDDPRAKELIEQAAYLQEVAPREMDEAELEPLVREAIEATGATSMRDMRAIIAHVSEHATSAFDNRMLSAIAKSVLMGGEK